TFLKDRRPCRTLPLGMQGHERSTPVLESTLGPQGDVLERVRVPCIPLSGRRVRLRAVVASDYEFLFRLATDERTGPRWRYRGLPPRPEEFVRDLWQQVLVQFLVERVDSGEPLGLVVAYEATMRDRHCHIAMLFRADVVVWPLEALVLFINFLFEEFAFNKL